MFESCHQTFRALWMPGPNFMIGYSRSHTHSCLLLLLSFATPIAVIQNYFYWMLNSDIDARCMAEVAETSSTHSTPCFLCTSLAETSRPFSPAGATQHTVYGFYFSPDRRLQDRIEEWMHGPWDVRRESDRRMKARVMMYVVGISFRNECISPLPSWSSS